MKNSQLNDLIHQRDNDLCINCGRYVDPGEKWHHEIPRSQGGKDCIEQGVTLCYKCHTERHHGKNSQLVRKKCVDYLNRLYGGNNGLCNT